MTSERGARPAEIAAPAMIAPMPNSTPRRRCTRSRRTKAIPIIRTPDGAMRPGATGMRHGPLAVHTVPTWPIIQLASGIVAQNKTRKMTPSVYFFFSMSLMSTFCPPAHEGRISLRPQLTGRARATAEAPIVPMRAVAHVAAMGVFDNDVEEWLSRNGLGHGEGAGLVDPHQRRVYDDTLVETQTQSDLHGLDGVVTAIGIAGIIGLAHAGDDVPDAAAIGQRAGEGEKDQIAPRHKGRRQTIGGDLDGYVAGQRAVGHRGERVKLDEVVLAEPR